MLAFELKTLSKNIRGQLNSKSYNYIILRGKKIVHGSVVVLEIKDFPKFAKVKKIFQIKGKIYFLLEKLETKFFDYYFHAYNVVEELDISLSNFELVHIERLPKHEPCLLVRKKFGTFVACRYDL